MQPCGSIICLIRVSYTWLTSILPARHKTLGQEDKYVNLTVEYYNPATNMFKWIPMNSRGPFY